jgi:hypothetical protein
MKDWMKWGIRWATLETVCKRYRLYRPPIRQPTRPYPLVFGRLVRDDWIVPEMGENLLMEIDPP